LVYNWTVVKKGQLSVSLISYERQVGEVDMFFLADTKMLLLYLVGVPETYKPRASFYMP